MPIFPYEYSYRSLLCRVKFKSDNSTVATYKHDALGRRVEKEVGSPRERYVYSGVETVSVYDSTNTWVRDFVFGQGIDEPLMLRQADVTDFDGDTDTSEVTRHFYHRNALGSVMMLTDMNEAEGVSYRYNPYGAVTITVGGTPQSDDPLGNPLMFTARFQDEETGLYYYRARHYSPATGRFLQRDPLGYGVGVNLYGYASLRPTVNRDPLGLEDSDAAGAKREYDAAKYAYDNSKKGYEEATQARDAYAAQAAAHAASSGWEPNTANTGPAGMEKTAYAKQLESLKKLQAAHQRLVDATRAYQLWHGAVAAGAPGGEPPPPYPPDAPEAPTPPPPLPDRSRPTTPPPSPPAQPAQPEIHPGFPPHECPGRSPERRPSWGELHWMWWSYRDPDGGPGGGLPGGRFRMPYPGYPPGWCPDCWPQPTGPRLRGR